MNGTPPQVSPTLIETSSDGDHPEEQQHQHPEEPASQQAHQQQPEKSSSSSTLFRGSKQGIRKLQKCLSTSVSHYDGEHQFTTSSNFPFHSQRSVDVRGYVATATSSSTAATAASSLQAASSSSLTSPFILTNTRQYSSFGSTNITIQLTTHLLLRISL